MKKKKIRERTPNDVTVCAMHHNSSKNEEEEVWLLLPRESGSRPHDYTRDPCRSKGHAHNREHGGFPCFDDLSQQKYSIFNIFWIAKNSENIGKKIGKKIGKYF